MGESVWPNIFQTNNNYRSNHCLIYFTNYKSQCKSGTTSSPRLRYGTSYIRDSTHVCYLFSQLQIGIKIRNYVNYLFNITNIPITWYMYWFHTLYNDTLWLQVVVQDLPVLVHNKAFIGVGSGTEITTISTIQQAHHLIPPPFNIKNVRDILNKTNRHYENCNSTIWFKTVLKLISTQETDQIWNISTHIGVCTLRLKKNLFIYIRGKGGSHPIWIAKLYGQISWTDSKVNFSY